MLKQKQVVIGCGDIGRRILQVLAKLENDRSLLYAISRTATSSDLARALGADSVTLDLDSDAGLPTFLHGAVWFYLAPPQKGGHEDLRSQFFLRCISDAKLLPKVVVLISTTGVYGDAGGMWVTEESETKPTTQRGMRRLDMEQQWRAWANKHDIVLRVLRVPGIYANSRIPNERLQKKTPVVFAQECGFSNRIHADDLAQICVLASRYTGTEQIFNATDGFPGTITQYLQAAAETIGLDPLPEISMADAESVLSAGMLSYLTESRKISNEKMRQELKVTLRYPDFKVGLRH